MTATDARPAPSGSQVQAAIRATYAAFIGAGFTFASWASRIPQVRTHLDLGPSELGLVLLAIAAGSVVALPASGPLIARFGSRRTVTSMAVLLAVAVALVAAGSQVGVLLLVVGLFLMGMANGAWDVAMNVQAAVVERLLGRAVMSRFHAGFSLGTVVGAGVGAAMVALDVSVLVHLLAVAVLVGVTVPLAVRRFVPDVHDDGADAAPAPRDSALRAWREPRTLLIGVFVLAFAFAEGAANDWISVALIDGHGTSAVVGTLGYAVFLVAMTAVRWAGPPLLARWGRVPMVRVLAVLSVVGLLLFVFGGHPAVAFAGALLWGAGASLGFPVGMSAAADDPARSAGRVSVVASIGYCAFLGGPPLIGLLGQSVGVLQALTVVAVLMAVATAIAGALRPPPGFTEQGV
ncbi:putative MFS-type transporter [Modestobacter italicus]|uniref:MFS-type transporter n=1 Tax=Modestobacter italicus (strain DSM 44449 / CECT 9708 / BC 501) TaxID=2732864 RepID=I4EZ75_MODI5|nr:MFS transporter [Modestobacter marinus]CCH88688.1 putative MFS-type transporter [Modestobacter marinus]